MLVILNTAHKQDFSSLHKFGDEERVILEILLLLFPLQRLIFPSTSKKFV